MTMTRGNRERVLWKQLVVLYNALRTDAVPRGLRLDFDLNPIDYEFDNARGRIQLKNATFDFEDGDLCFTPFQPLYANDDEDCRLSTEHPHTDEEIILVAYNKDTKAHEVHPDIFNLEDLL